MATPDVTSIPTRDEYQSLEMLKRHYPSGVVFSAPDGSRCVDKGWVQMLGTGLVATITKPGLDAMRRYQAASQRIDF